jgi:DNA mismatch repair protein MutS2
VLNVGQPGRSNAFAIAKRLGLPQAIIERAKQWISSHDLEADKILERIRRSRREIGRATNAAQTSLSSARRQERDARRVLRETRQERHHLLEDARRMLAEAQDELERIRKAGQSRRITDEWIEESSKRLEQLADSQQLSKPFNDRPADLATRSQQDLAVGDTVWIAGLDQTGQIMSVANGEAEIQVGLFRAKVPLVDLERREPPTPTKAPGPVRVELAPRPGPTVELNLRGMRAQEAIARLSKYLDDGYLAALPFARVIHGKGTGALRAAVREALAEHPLVASFRPGRPDEGGEGATIVAFVPRPLS